MVIRTGTYQVGSAENVVRQHLSQQGSVARDLCRDTAERLIVGRKYSVVALGERGEEGGTLGGVGDARGDLHERVETGTPVCQPVCTVARGVKNIREGTKHSGKVRLGVVLALRKGRRDGRESSSEDGQLHCVCFGCGSRGSR